LEAAAFVAGERHTDTPRCASQVLITAGHLLNDNLEHAERQQLKALVPSIIGTNRDGGDGARVALVIGFAMGTTVPMWLDLCGLTDIAAHLREYAPWTAPEIAACAPLLDQYAGAMRKVRDENSYRSAISVAARLAEHVMRHTIDVATKNVVDDRDYVRNVFNQVGEMAEYTGTWGTPLDILRTLRYRMTELYTRMTAV
jgi:hypothetical protein